MKNNTIIILLVIVVIIMYFFYPSREQFSDSGLNMSDAYCEKLGAVYYKPRCQHDETTCMNKICGAKRRFSINHDTGNYFTEGGQLV